MVRRIFLSAAPQGGARCRRHFLRLARQRRLGRRLRFYARCRPRLPENLSRTCQAEFWRIMERGRPRGATDPARTLRRIQSALRPWHHLRTENRRQCGFHPVVDAAGSEMAVMQDEAKVEYVQMKDS